MQDGRTSQCQDGLHAGIIMDGNGRWALARGLPRVMGHKEGIKALWRACEAAPALGVGTLTVYAFSCDNWQRPPDEVSALMSLLRGYLETECDRLRQQGIRLSIIGRRDRLPEGLAEIIADAEQTTRSGAQLHLRVAIDYSGRDSILRAATSITKPQDISPEYFGASIKGASDVPDVDLIIRTSGEQRLSDFLLWEGAYAELHFTKTLWPDFGAEDLEVCLADFRGRSRRFGGRPGEMPSGEPGPQLLRST